MTEQTSIYTVFEFTLKIKKLLTSSGFDDVCIKGEISNFKLHSSGHSYFSLKDKNSKLECVMFKWYYQSLKFEPENGMNVLIFGSLDIYEPRGQYQLKVREILQDGIGELYKAYEQLKNKLALEGIFSSEHKKPIPKFPKKIGVATSETGAVLHDIVTVLKRRYPVDVLFIPTTVQGETASKSIVNSINLLNKTDVDVIILGRGGGSIEDLWAFNEEIVVRAVFNSKIPIISAVGHETDFTLCDFVADKRSPTPSAAAEIAVPDKTELLTMIKKFSERLINSEQKIIENKTTQFLDIKSDLEYGILFDKLDDNIQYLDELKEKNIEAIYKIFNNKEMLIKLWSGRLNSVSPLETFSRGYSIALKYNKTIKSINDVEKDDNIELIVRDGKIKCVVNIKEKYKWK